MWFFSLLARFPFLWLVLALLAAVSGVSCWLWGREVGRDEAAGEWEEQRDHLLRMRVVPPDDTHELEPLDPPPPGHPVWRNPALKPPGPAMVPGENPGRPAWGHETAGPGASLLLTRRASPATAVRLLMAAELDRVRAALPEGWQR